MNATSPVLSNHQALIAAIKADPTDRTAQLALADCIAETTGDYDAAVVEAELIALDASVHGKGRKASGYRGEICRQAGATDRRGRPLTCVSIRIVAGGMEPEYEGSSYYFTNASGDRIRYPNAYRRAWGKPIYHAACHIITVGADWVRENIL